VTETLDSALKARLRAVLGRRSATEAELRKLTEEGDACILILDARLARSEQHLAELSSDPASSFTEIAAEMRAVDEVRPDLDELRALLAELGELAREFRASWLSGRSLVDR
jgi:chromosome segregation ATPase